MAHATIMATMPTIFSLFVSGYISPYPTVATVVNDHDAAAVYTSKADFASPLFSNVIQVWTVGSRVNSKLETRKKRQAIQWTKKKMNRKILTKSITIPILSLKKNHSNYIFEYW